MTEGNVGFLRTPAEISASITPVNYGYDPGDLRRYGGVGDGTTNNNTAFTNANSVAAAVGGTSVIHLPAGDYLVTALPTIASGVRLTGEGRIVTTTSHRRTWEYGGMTSSTGDRTYYVNVATGNDKNDGTTATPGSGNVGPLKTLQRAWNMLPPIILHRQTINYANGNYEENELAAGSMERAAILYCTGKYIRGRTDQGAGGTSTTGYVLFVPASATAKIRTIGSYIYGCYITQVSNVGFSGFNFDSNVAGTVAGLVAHRPGTYVQVANPVVSGNLGQCGIGAYAEAGGVLEMTGAGSLTGSGTDVLVFDESLIQVSNSISMATFSINGRGSLLLAGTVTVTGAGYIQNGQLNTRGTNTSNRVVLNSLTVINGEINATFTNFSGAANLFNSDAYLNTCAYSNAWLLQNSDIYLSATPSFISPATANTVADPVTLLTGSRFIRDNATSSPINGSGGRTNAVRHVISVSVSSNGATMPVYLAAADNVHHTIDGNGGNRTGCILAAVDTSYGGAPIENTVLSLINTTTNSVQLVDSTTADFVSGAIALGQNSGNYQGVTLRWTAGRWREVSRSLVVP